MLVTFKCKVSGNIVMFGDVAKQMLKMMGFCETIPGAICAEDIPVALVNLQQATHRIHKQETDIQGESGSQTGSNEEFDELDAEPVISLNTRAVPLIEMLEAAKREECHIMWE